MKLFIAILCAFSTFFFFSHSALAKSKQVKYKVYKTESKNRAQIDFNSPVYMVHTNSSWNTNPNAPDTGKLAIFDRKTSNLKLFKLTESGNNTGIFKKKMLSQELGNVAAEFYSIPEEIASASSSEKIREYINKGFVRRKPFIMRKLKSGNQEVDVFSSKAQLDLVLDQYRKKYNLVDIADPEFSRLVFGGGEKIEKRAIVSSAFLQNALNANQSNAAAEASKNLESQEVLAKIERDKKQKRLNEFKQLTDDKAAAQKRKAKDLAATAIKAYKEGRYKEANKNFERSISIDPTNRKLYYQYGVSLYRVDEYNKSIAILTNAVPPRGKEYEKLFYLGLNQHKLHTHKEAIRSFDSVVNKAAKSTAVSASFYKGISQIEISEYKKAINSFQYVIDNSTDPNLDKRAEDYIEYAIRRQELERRFSKSLFANITVGTMHDSNVLFASNSARDQGAATNTEAYRLITQAQLRYRPYYDEHNEVSAVADVSTLHTVNNSFESTSTTKQVDPLVYSIKVPWTHKTKWNKSAYNIDIEAGFESLAMNLDGTSQKAILDSMLLNLRNNVILSKDWILNADLSIRNDNSHSTSGDNNEDAQRYTLTFGATYVLSQESQQYLIPELGFTFNDAVGTNASFQRLDLGLTFITETFWDMAWNSKIALYNASYNNVDSASARTDTNVAFSTGLTKALTPQWTTALSLTYTDNTSNTNQYNKFTSLLAFVYSY